MLGLVTPGSRRHSPQQIERSVTDPRALKMTSALIQPGLAVEYLIGSDLVEHNR